MHFCTLCQNKLHADTSDGGLRFVCKSCNEFYDAKPEDTLMHDKTYNEQSSIPQFKHLIEYASDDKANPKVEESCKKCGENIVRYIRIGTEGTEVSRIYACECGHRWRDVKK